MKERRSFVRNKGWLMMFLSFAFLFGCQEQMKEWEHGWETTHVRATRYSSEVVGFNIGFTFPRNPGDSDRIEILDFIEQKHGGRIYQMGGYPGAEVLAIFPDVKDKESANSKLHKMLPEFDSLIASF